MDFKFELRQQVRIAASKESGEVVARAQYSNSTDSYLIRYCAADGRAVEQWWHADALENAA